MSKFKNKFLYDKFAVSINYLTNKTLMKKTLSSLVSNEINVFDVGSNLGSYLFVSNQNKDKVINFYSFERI